MRQMKRILVAVMIGAACVSAGCRRDAAGESPRADRDAKVEQASQRTNQAMKKSKSGYDVTPLPKSEVEKLAEKLDPEVYRITQKEGTERAFTGALLKNKEDGTYTCAVCSLPLFTSDTKFDSGTGWPSFYREFDPDHVARITDKSHGMVRTEIECARCGAHLGHVFNDGPAPTGERHCLNSASLTFVDEGKPLPDRAPSAKVESEKTETAYFAGGCFWGVEHYFQKGPGVIDAVSGYMQGDSEQPDYKSVCTKETGHAETVKVVFDPDKITFRRLLEAFFVMHNPTQLNRQGPDVGSQYRSGVWYVSEAQKREAEAYIAELEKSGQFRNIVTQVEPAKKFWPAEDYHQDYIVKTGRACHVKNPW